MRLNFNAVMKDVDKEIPKLQRFVKENEPMTEEEVFQMFVSSDTIKMFELLKRATALSPQLNLMALYEEDVYSYFNLPYKTSAEKSEFEATEEYQCGFHSS